jgi:hypothetical protein
MTFVVYALVDPRTDAVFYVGHTGNHSERKAQHLAGTDQMSGLFVQQMLLNGYVPLFIVLERCEMLTQALASEIFWIEVFRTRGAKLLNGQIVGGAVAKKQKRRDLTATRDQMTRLKDIANGRPANGFKPWTARDRARLAGMRKAKMSPEAMADALERPLPDIERQLAKLDQPSRKSDTKSAATRERGKRPIGQVSKRSTGQSPKSIY